MGDLKSAPSVRGLVEEKQEGSVDRHVENAFWNEDVQSEEENFECPQCLECGRGYFHQISMAMLVAYVKAYSPKLETR
ncbi:unnamed protein product [Fusarium graminearum]|nr:unnamed protein product [Fusarium graminearum]CAG1995845.1 unnamed protein product [Fusarium graminearum]CAG2006839.1 unnamed protein product [Fusarium graminearum]VTO81805.1 unnamed protein product [Fusarium graminearum]